MKPGRFDPAGMFSSIAPRYDRINRAISLGLDKGWRRALLANLPRDWRPLSILDVCCGTGMLLRMLALAYPRASVTGLDFSPGMLVEASRRIIRLHSPRPELYQGDLNDLPFGDGCFELVTNAFGLRNSVDPDRSLLEMRRVLAPGGRLALLELTNPGKEPAGRLICSYLTCIAPYIAACMGGVRSAYAYLPTTIKNFFTSEELGERITVLIEGEVSVVPIFGSVVTLILAHQTG